MSSKIDAGLEFISALSSTELKPIEIQDLLNKLISKDFNTIDKILETAQEKKLLQRTEKPYLLTPKASILEFEKPRIIKQKERDACKLCRNRISNTFNNFFLSPSPGTPTLSPMLILSFQVSEKLSMKFGNQVQLTLFDHLQ